MGQSLPFSDRAAFLLLNDTSRSLAWSARVSNIFPKMDFSSSAIAMASGKVWPSSIAFAMMAAKRDRPNASISSGSKSSRNTEALVRPAGPCRVNMKFEKISKAFSALSCNFSLLSLMTMPAWQRRRMASPRERIRCLKLQSSMSFNSASVIMIGMRWFFRSSAFFFGGAMPPFCID